MQNDPGDENDHFKQLHITIELFCFLLAHFNSFF